MDWEEDAQDIKTVASEYPKNLRAFLHALCHSAHLEPCNNLPVNLWSEPLVPAVLCSAVLKRIADLFSVA